MQIYTERIEGGLSMVPHQQQRKVHFSTFISERNTELPSVSFHCQQVIYTERTPAEDVQAPDSVSVVQKSLNIFL